MRDEKMVAVVTSAFAILCLGFAVFVQWKYVALRRAYVEVAIQVVEDRLPRPINQEDLKNARAAVEKSEPRLMKGTEFIDMGFYKDPQDGKWKTK